MTITTASTNSNGTLGNLSSSQANQSVASQFSADNRYVVFQSTANNLVPGDTNGSSDVFVKDLQTGQVMRVDTTVNGTQATGGVSLSPSISADGRFVTFQSSAPNLVPGDTNNIVDIFMKDLQTGAITRVNVLADGTQATGGASTAASISANGQFVVFQSQATNLVPGDTNGGPDIFVKNLATGTITRVDTMADGSQVRLGATVGTISADGRYVAFQSGAPDLVPGDTKGQIDIFVKDLQTGAITRVSTAADGAEGGGSSTFAEISANGRFVVFQSNSQEIVPGDTNGQTDIFVKDLQTGAITRANTAADGTQADSWASSASISADGRFVTFTSNASNLVPGDTNFITDVFVKDMLTGAIFRPNVADDGTEANGTSSNPVISPDGHHVIFASNANNLVPGDTNRVADDFVANACYCTHTLILTSGGEVPVEALSVGDLVVTASGEHRPIRWIGHRLTDVARHPRTETVMPVRIRAGAVAPGVPVRDLLVSPGHAVAIEGVLVKAGRLVNGATILRESVERVTYWHIELDSHDLLVADGMPAESYVDCGNRHAFDNGGPIVSMHPEFDALDAHATQTCLPLIDGGSALASIREALIARAGAHFSAEPVVRLLADGVALAPMSVEGRRYHFCVPEGARVLRLVSRYAVPGEVHAASTDRRRIGIAVRGLTVDGVAIACDDLGEGWHAQVPGRDHRWSDGDAALPLGREISFTIFPLERYPSSNLSDESCQAA